MKSALILIILNACLEAVGQGTIFLKNGESIRFSKFSKGESSLMIKEPNKKGKTDIIITDVNSYFDDYEQIMYFAKPDSSGLWRDYHFMKKVASGSINLYERITYDRFYTLPGPHDRVQPVDRKIISYFIEKDYRFEYISSNQLIFKRKKKEILKSFVADNELLLQTIDDNFRLNNESVLDIVERYNVSKHTKQEEKDDLSSMATAVFFRSGKDITTNLEDRIKYSRESDEVIKFTICDTPYTLKPYSHIEVKVPADRHLKICFGEDPSACNIIFPYSCFTNRFEINVNKNSGRYSIEAKDIEADFLIKKLDEYKPRKQR